MTESEKRHRMPEALQRVARGQYAVKGTELRIVQGDDGKWRIEGHADDPSAFASRGAALAKLEELGAVPAVQPEQPAPQQPAEQPEGDAKRPTVRKPRTRKEPAKASQAPSVTLRSMPIAWASSGMPCMLWSRVTGRRSSSSSNRAS